MVDLIILETLFDLLNFARAAMIGVRVRVRVEPPPIAMIDNCLAQEWPLIGQKVILYPKS